MRRKRRDVGEAQPNKVVNLYRNPNEQPQEAPANTGRRTGPAATLLVPAFVVLILVGVVFFLWRLYRNQNYDEIEVVSETENTSTSQMSYIPYRDGLAKFGQEGVSYLNSKGVVVWMESYKMKEPEAVASDDYLAVADLNGNTVYVFNENGRVNEMQTPYSITKIDVASQGVFAVVLENESEDFIQLYDKYGSLLVEMRTTVSDSGYPFDIGLSDNGNKLVTSYLTIEGINLSNTIAMYNFDEVGQNVTDRLVGGFNNLEGAVVPCVEFVNNDTICAFGDDKFIIYAMREKPSEKATITGFNGEIQSIFYNSKCVGAVEKGDLGTGDGGSLYKARIFDFSGNERFTFDIPFSYQNVYATEDSIVVVGTSDVLVYNMQGHKVFGYTFAKEVKNFVPTGSNREYLVVYEDVTDIVKAVKAVEEEAIPEE